MENGVVKRISDKGASKRVNFKGMAHSMHRKDGVEGDGSKDGKVAYKDLGEKSEFNPDGGKQYPSLHVSGDKLKDLHDSKVGDAVEMNVKGSLKEHRLDDKGKHHFHVEVTHAAVKK